MNVEESYECMDCGSEFEVTPTGIAKNMADEVSFCPYCGRELYELEDDEEDDEKDYWY